MARTLDMETFRAILESLKILDSKEEVCMYVFKYVCNQLINRYTFIYQVDCIIKAIDNNNDKRISESELKGFLFPEPPENFVSLLEAKFIQVLYVCG